MTKKRKWTTEEERVLVDQITRHAYIKDALKNASRLIDRTEAACMYHWYTVVSKRENSSVCLVSIGQKTSPSWWGWFLKRLFSFLKRK